MAENLDFDRWNEEFGGDQAVEALKKAAENNKEFEEVPDGTYICKLEVLELGESKNNKPMIKGRFKILEGAYKKQCLFINQVITSGFPMHKGLEFLRSLDVFATEDIDFNGNFKYFNDLLLDIAEESEDLKFEVEKTKDGDYTRLTVLDSF